MTKQERITASETALAKANIGRMKSDGLITQRADGTILLRSYGRAALVTLAAAAANMIESVEESKQTKLRRAS